MAAKKTNVSLFVTENRETGIEHCIDALGVNPVTNKNVLIKPNFNTADPAPGSTHNDTLVSLVKKVWDMGAKSIRIGERSFPLTRQVMEQKGILPLLKELDVDVVDFDTLDKKDWVEMNPTDTHWRDGFRVARPVLEAECLISTGCLKTHQFGGVFTLSLKLHVGVVPTTRHGFDYMTELHTSPHQNKLIAEINQPFQPDLVLIDGIDAFVDGGPATGKHVHGNLLLASTDRVAIDAVGVAALKTLGSNQTIMKTRIFDHEQIARAAEIGIGVTSVEQIEIISTTKESQATRDKVVAQLK
ncbi:MAG: hypothetical protein DRH90_18845 [Deltaproteobacteria bacterium]|nr:MAG: hypothetical protein DRH90_18845 [Deltaproteobacteria bacterium]RLC10979.1 MAG: hypothetical protein DRI24_19490 [Deltaproteobacteria bacterium]